MVMSEKEFRTIHPKAKYCIGQKFNKLNVIDYNKKSGSKYIWWKCKCDCGQVCKINKYQVTCGRVTACQQCRSLRNGVRVSSNQLKVYEILGRGIVNFKTRHGRFIDIAIAQSGQKIAIEYDCVFWHHTPEGIVRDKKRNKELMCDGWKILHIVALNMIPTRKQLLNELNTLIIGTNLEHSLYLADVK